MLRPPACKRSFLAVAPRLGFELSKVWVESTSLPSPASSCPAACGHYKEAFLLDPFPLLSPLSPGDRRGTASPTTSTPTSCSPGPDPRLHTDRGTPRPAVGSSPVLRNSAPRCRSPTPDLPFFTDTETQVERPPGDFFPQTTHACLPRRYRFAPSLPVP